MSKKITTFKAKAINIRAETNYLKPEVKEKNFKNRQREKRSLFVQKERGKKGCVFLTRNNSSQTAIQQHI